MAALEHLKASPRKVIAKCDPDRTFVEQLPFLEHAKLPAMIKKFDLFLFLQIVSLCITLDRRYGVGYANSLLGQRPYAKFLEDRGIL